MGFNTKESEYPEQVIQLGRVVSQTPCPKAYSNTIATLQSSTYFVFRESLIQDLIYDLKALPQIAALGVLNEEMEVVGVIISSEFTALMARPYLFELLGKQPVGEILIPVQSFFYRKNIYSVAARVDDDLQKSRSTYYTLVDENSHFCGLVNSQDILIYLYNNTKKDIALAKVIQEGIVKAEVHQVHPSLEIFAAASMAKSVGGDYYSIQNYDQDRWVFSVCDVSGKGIAASLVTTLLGGMNEVYDFRSGLKKYIQEVNAFVLKTFQLEKYLTGIFIDYDGTKREMVYYDMGHSYLFVFRAGRVLKGKTLNPFVGFLADLDPQAQKISLQEKDLVVLITDGIPEQRNSSNEEYGIQRFVSVVLPLAELDLPEIQKALWADVERFRENHPVGDDLTMLMFRVK